MDFPRGLVPAAIRRRYAVKFGIALLVLGLSVGLIGFVATAGITHEVEERVQDDHAEFAGQEAQGLQMWNEQNEHTIGVIAWSGVVAADDPAAIQERFLDWEEHLDADTFAISYVDTDEGTVLASTDDDLREASADEIENVPEVAYESATEQVPWVSSPYVLEGELGEETAVITYVLSVPGQDDRAIVYTADLEAYGSQFQDDERTTTVVVDGADRIILDDAGYGDEYETLNSAYDGDAGLLEAARTEGASTQELETAPSVLESYGFEADEYVASAARVSGTDWVVVTHEPIEETYGFVAAVNEWGLIATAVGVLLIGAVGAVVGRNTASSIDKLTRKAERMEEGDLDVDLETKRIDNIGRLYDGFDSMRVALRDQIEEAEAAREEAERERERVEQINARLEEKADEYSDVMEAAAAGDLTARMDVDDGNADDEAMAEIAAEFNEMLAEIETTVAEAERFATAVATASEQVTASSEEVRSASRQVTESIQEISDGAERQNEALQSVNQEMSALSTTTEEIAASSNEVADLAERTAETGESGREAARDAVTAMDEIEDDAKGAVTEIRRLEEEVQQIDELIATISEIARQTNMLALNANIEASRSASGEDDEGFAAVAQEVKALSENVAEAADEAEKRLEAIRDRTERSAAEIEGTSAEIEDASRRVSEAVEALEAIAKLADETNVGVQEISAATQQQAASTQEVVAMVDDAATISEETTAEAENVAAAAEEQTSALTEVTQSASSLSEQAVQLSEALDRFDTEAEPEDLASDVAVDVGEFATNVVVEAEGEDAAETEVDDTPAEISADEILGLETEGDAEADVETDDGTEPIAFDDEAPSDAADPLSPVDEEASDSAAVTDAGGADPLAPTGSDGEADDESETEHDDVFTFGEGEDESEGESKDEDPTDDSE
ncbi:methyl-accepting chemotaxis protein [Natronobacterium lacisalsi]|uniref:methyl-accepting chemotaxis protein n=1 Tax=Natronobacterium lacisalsi TaxID=229731 RepID=UPI00067814A8|nr:methyl-accepting chemotaxis protein [Halobiforma lacisalsi]